MARGLDVTVHPVGDRQRAVVVGVVDPLDMVRDAIRSHLQRSGYSTVDQPTDPVRFLWEGRNRALVASITVGFGLRDLERAVRANRAAPIVALVDGLTPLVYCELLHRCRVYPVSRGTSAATIVECLTAALNGMCLMPAALARELASNAPQPCEGIDAEELSWLRRLATGTTVEELAADIGLSERTTYRRLRRVYRKLGAQSRAEAELLLARADLI